MKKRYNGEDNSYITSEDSNSGMKEAYDVGQAETRINNAKERMRAEAEGARDEGKITESGDQGFGGAGSSRTVKATPKPATKPAAKPATKTTDDSEITRMKNRGKSAEMPSGSPGRGKFDEMPADVSKMSLADRAKRSREMARSGSGSTDTRSVGERLRSAFAGKNRGGNSVDFGGTGLGMKSGGSVSSASRRADGIATKGKTRGKYI